MNDTTTTNLADFSSSERELLIELLQAWKDQGLPEDFSQDEVVPMMNKNSGCVFLTNSKYQVAMMNGDKLESFYTCANCVQEGFLEDVQIDNENICCNHCREKGDE